MKKYFTKPTFIALLFPFIIYSVLSFITLPKINSLFQQIFLNTAIGEKIIAIQPNLFEEFELSFTNIFLFLQFNEPQYLISYDIYSIDGSLEIGIALFLMIAAICFISAGYYLGKKEQSYYNIITFSIMYSFILFILSIFSKTSYLNNINELIHIELLFRTNVTMLLLSSIITYTGYTIANKKLNSSREIIRPLQVIGINLVFYFTMVAAFLVVAFGMIRERLNYMFPSQSITEYFQLSIELISTLASQLSIYIFHLSHMLPITIVSEENNIVQQAAFSIHNGMELNGEFSIGMLSLFVIRDLLNKVPYDEYLVYLSLLPIILIFIAGYKEKSERFSWDKVIQFTFYYSAIAISIITICNFEIRRIDFISKDSYYLYFDINIWTTIFMFVFISFISFTAGHFIKKQVKIPLKLASKFTTRSKEK